MFLKNWIASSLAFAMLFSTNSLQASSGVKGDTADYVVVGVGTAGSLLANKLSADKKTSVIALHSGQNFVDSFIIKYSKNTVFSVLATLLGSPLPFDPTELDLLPPDIRQELEEILALSSDAAKPLYETGATIPQTNADDRKILWVIPLPLGGASSINAGAWCWGTDQVYSQWEAINGPAWSVERIRGIYKELEHYHGQTSNPVARGHHGPICTQQVANPSNVSVTFAKAVMQATGVPFVQDYNDPQTPIGASSQFQLTHKGKDGFYRDSGVNVFLNHNVMKSDGTGVKGRKLQVHLNSFALRTIWEGNKAVGVEYLQNGITKRVFAKKGVMVCAGLRSSIFLMYSGVGPSALLTSHGIPVVYDNPNVGQGLADQPQVAMLFSANPNDSKGMTNSAFCQISWLPAPNGDPNVRQVRFATLDFIPGLALCLLDLVQPKSRGSIKISSSNPLAPPIVDMGLLSNSGDLDLYTAAFTTYIKNINAQLQAIDPEYQLLFPPPEILDSPALVAAFVEDSIVSNQSFQSHCRMAPLNQGGVVDPSGRVYGVQNLFVADDSIVPVCMDGSSMATAYLIAANIAKLLGY